MPDPLADRAKVCAWAYGVPSQAIAFAIGGFAGAAGLDLMRHLVSSTPAAFATVFLLEGGIFVGASWFALAPWERKLSPAAADRAFGDSGGKHANEPNLRCIVLAADPRVATAADDLARRGRKVGASGSRRSHQAALAAPFRRG